MTQSAGAGDQEEVKPLLTMDALGHHSFLSLPPAHILPSANICPNGQENSSGSSERFSLFSHSGKLV